MKNLSLIILIFVLLFSCSEDHEVNAPLNSVQTDTLVDDSIEEPRIVLETFEVTDITDTTAIAGGNVLDYGGKLITEKGLCWDTLPNPTYDGIRSSDGLGLGEFESELIGLKPATKYYYRSYAKHIEGAAYGEEKNFTTTRFFPNEETMSVFLNVNLSISYFGLDLQEVRYSQEILPFQRFYYTHSAIPQLGISSIQVSVYYDELISRSFAFLTHSYDTLPLFVIVKLSYSSGQILNAGMNQGRITVEDNSDYYAIYFDGVCRNFLGAAPLDQIGIHDGVIYVHK